MFADGTVAVDDLQLEIADGEFMIFVGPSGCGKTTALRMVAGLEQPTAGEILIGDTVVNDLDPVDRDIAMVFQNYALYPHMTVRANIGFPLETQRVPKAEREQRIEEAATLLGLEGLLDRKPRALSGGQRQRVAMGRAIVRHPRCFLMDEPLSNLDAKLRVQMRAELVKLHQRLGVTTLYVTHDQVEAMTLGQRVAVLEPWGRAAGRPARASSTTAPRTLFVASFIGSPAMNFLRAKSDGTSIAFATHRLPLPGDGGPLAHARAGRDDPGPPARAFLRHLVLRGRPDRFPATVELTEQLGSEALVYFRLDGVAAETLGTESEAELGGAFVGTPRPASPDGSGQQLELVVDVVRAHFFDPADGRSLRSPS